MFGIGDQTAGFGGRAPLPGRGWLGVGSSAVLIGAAEDLVCPALRLEYWDGEPPTGPPDHEAQETTSLLLPTGRLALDEITGGAVPDVFVLPPGVYALRITCWNRERVRREFEALCRGGLDWDGPEFEAARAGLAGQERYLFQFWLQAPTSALLGSTGVLIHPGYDRLGITDSAARVTLIPPAEAEPLTVGPSSVLIPMEHQHGRPALRMESWNGPPPAPGPDHPGKQLRLHLPSGRLDLLHLPAGPAGVGEISAGMIPRIFDLPPGDYELRLTRRGSEPGEDARKERQLIQFWPIR
ncbi:hypothetical protein [Micromonospora citrea]|nr:hypothetical protein [Micromonospora citrea]